MDYENEIKPLIVNSMINVKNKSYNNALEKEFDLQYNLALSEILLKLNKTNDFLIMSKEIGGMLKIT